MSLDPEDRALLLQVLVVAKECRDASLAAAASSKAALDQLRDLNEIVAREVTPLGPFRADLLDKLERHFNKIGAVELEVTELDEWRREHDERHRHASNGG